MNVKYNIVDDEYFDMLLKRACEECILDEGEELLKELETLQEHEFSEKFCSNMDKLMKKEFNIKSKKKTFKFSSMMKMVSVLIVFMISFICFSSIDVIAFKVKFIQDFIKKYEDHSDETYIIENFDYDMTKIPEEWDYIYIPRNVPKAFNLTEMEINEAVLNITYEISDKFIIFEQRKTINTLKAKDEENIDMEEIMIKKNKGLYSEKDGIKFLIWSNGDFYFKLKSNLEKEELLDIAGSLKILGK